MAKMRGNAGYRSLTTHHSGQFTLCGVRVAFQTSRCSAWLSCWLQSRASAASTIQGLSSERARASSVGYLSFAIPRGSRITSAPLPINRITNLVMPATLMSPRAALAMAMLLRRMKQDVTVHGFRSAFRDWAAECTGYSHEVAEMALAHTIGNAVERAYRRGDLFEKRRRLMFGWATYCASGAPAGGMVLPINSAAITR